MTLRTVTVSAEIEAVLQTVPPAIRQSCYAALSKAAERLQADTFRITNAVVLIPSADQFKTIEMVRKLRAARAGERYASTETRILEVCATIDGHEYVHAEFFSA